jgi:phosphoglycolate phosphatase
MSNIKLIIFDWEGTLNDTWGKFLVFIREYVQKRGWTSPSNEDYRKVFRMPLELAIAELFPEKGIEQQENLLQFVQANLWQFPNKISLFPGVKDCLMQCLANDKIMAVASNKQALALSKAIQDADLTQFFKIVCSASDNQPKPSTQMLEVILKKCALKPENAIMVGDSDVDILMAKAHGVRSIAFDYYHQRNTNDFLLLGANKVIHNINCLLETINNL